MDVLGIGANMVKSLRYWLQATGLTVEPNSGKRTQSLTTIGEIIYNNDPYFEETGSLWLVHYGLATNFEDATSWYLFFNEFQMQEFSEDDFINHFESSLLCRTAKLCRVPEQSVMTLNVLLTLIIRAKETPVMILIQKTISNVH